VRKLPFCGRAAKGWKRGRGGKRRGKVENDERLEKKYMKMNQSTRLVDLIKINM
jgi:hypothetical protein